MLNSIYRELVVNKAKTAAVHTASFWVVLIWPTLNIRVLLSFLRPWKASSTN